MEPNKNIPPGLGWMNIIWNIAQTISFVVLQLQQNHQHTQQNKQHTYDREKLELDARDMRATASERFGATNERIRSTQRNGLILGGLGGFGALLLLRGGNKAIQKLKSEQNTSFNQLDNDLNQLQTRTDAQLKQTQETAQKLVNELQSQLKQTQDNLQNVSNDLEGKLEATAKGGVGSDYASGGNVSIDSGLFGRMYEVYKGDRALLERQIESCVAPKLCESESKFDTRSRELESKFNTLNIKFIKL